jgi:clan AA aspartic protease
MIIGTVNARREAIITLVIRNPAGEEQRIESILDTGLIGSLTLPPLLISSLGLPRRSRSSAILANGQIEEFNIHAGTIVWDGAPRPILIQAVDNVPLLGMALLANHDLRVRVATGGIVEIEAAR